MENKEKKSINYYMRMLHRDIGFLLIGLIIVFSLSGIVLIFRDSDFLKSKNLIERKLTPNINITELGKALHERNLEVLKTVDEVVYFKNGTYNKTTGVATYIDKSYPLVIEKLNNLHKSSSHSLTHWFTLLFSILLFFLAISSFWMFKPKTKMFRRGLILAGSGIVIAFVLLFL